MSELHIQRERLEYIEALNNTPRGFALQLYDSTDKELRDIEDQLESLLKSERSRLLEMEADLKRFREVAK